MNKQPLEDAIYPVKKETIEDLLVKIKQTVKVNSCLTFSFGEFVGGSRAWFKFIFKNPELFSNYIHLKKNRMVIFDVTECYDSSNLAFFYLLLKQVAPSKEIPDYDKASLQQVLDLLKNNFSKFSSKKKLIVFALKFDNFTNLNPQLGNLLYSLWKDNKEKIIFIFTLNRNLSKKKIKNCFGAFSEAILQNQINVDSVSKDDILQSICHWEKELYHKFSEIEKLLITKYSRNLPYLSKVLCQDLSKDPSSASSFEKRCQEISRELLTGGNNSKLVLKKNGSLVFFNNEDVSRNFSYQEFSVLKLLIEKSGIIVNRDEIADCLWGKKAFEKYSEWAIDKFVSLVRAKLNKLDFAGEIKAKKGEGFILLQPE